jgi:hypothetical protein
MEDCGHREPGCLGDDLLATAVEERIGGNHQRADAQFGEGREGRIDLAFGGGAYEAKLDPHRPRRRL